MKWNDMKLKKKQEKQNTCRKTVVTFGHWWTRFAVNTTVNLGLKVGKWLEVKRNKNTLVGALAELKIYKEDFGSRQNPFPICISIISQYTIKLSVLWYNCIAGEWELQLMLRQFQVDIIFIHTKRWEDECYGRSYSWFVPALREDNC